jgi:Ni,Fe-hydrogenase III small subunit
MLKEFNLLQRQGNQSIPDVRRAAVSDNLTGRPVIATDIDPDEGLKAAHACPTGAITTKPFSIDLGKCLFCKECSFLLPDKIKFTSDYRLASNRRENIIARAGEDKSVEVDRQAVRPEVRRLFKHALKLRQVSAGGDNSCEMELNASGNVNFDMGRFGIEFVASPRHADGIVITGPLTANMARALEMTYEAVPEPRIIILAGTDAISSGMFEGSPALDRSFLDKYPVDLYVPGNPVHPLTFVNGLLDLTGRR